MAERSAGPVQPQQLVELLELFLFGEPPSMTSLEVADRVGIPIEVARARWRSLGFTAVPEDEVAFTEADLHALELTERLREIGIVDPASEAALIRTIGRAFARLSEWQLTVLGQYFDLETMDLDQLGEAMSEVTPVIEEVMNYVWRRHTLSAASRLLLAPVHGEDGPTQAVGFADIVGYTTRSRSMRQEELALLVDSFEAEALEIITEHNGRIIKTIGDEVLFVTDLPAEAAEIALQLTERNLDDKDFPQLRVGLAFGPVLARFGDVFGPVVNLASRLTSTAHPGRTVVDREMAEALKGDDSFRLRRMRRTSVKGYRRLEPWSLKRPMGQDPEFESDRLPGPASQFLAQHGRDLVRAVEEGQPALERSPGRKRAK